MLILLAALVLALMASFAGWRFPQLRYQLFLAAVLSLPVLFLPLLTGSGFYISFLWDILAVAALGALINGFYYQELRRFVSPTHHPKRFILKWLAFIPALVLITYLTSHFSLLSIGGVGVAVALITSLFLGGTLIVDTFVSAFGFGLLYTAFYLILPIPLHLGLGSGAFSQLAFLSHPVGTLLTVFVFGCLWGPVCAAFREPYTTEITYTPKHQLLKRVLVGLAVIAVGGSSYWVYSHFVTVPRVIAASPASGEELEGLTDPIVVTFDKAVSQQDITATISPKIEGDISFSNPYFGRAFLRELIFTPRQHLAPNTVYTLHISHITNLLGQAENDYSLRFHTPDLPHVVSTSISNAQENVAICDPLSVTLNQPAKKLAEFTFQLTPPVAFTTQLDTKQTTYQLKPEHCLDQSVKYTLSIQRRLTVFDDTNKLVNTDEPVTLQSLTFTTKGAPGIAGVSPQGSGLGIDTKQLSINFTEEMATDSPQYPSITPAIPGAWHWQDKHTLLYTISANLSFETTYSITVAMGQKDARGGFLPADSTFSFTTLGHVRVNGITPRSGSGGVSVGSSIRMSFDQPVDHASAEQHFSLSPATNGSFSWQGQTLIYSTSLSKDTGYTASLSPGVVSLIGLASTGSFSSTFQTEESVTLLNIPVYYQQKALSCEAASLKMALSFKGKGVSEDTILNAMGADTTPRQGNSWGDPDLSFVGDVNGRQNSTGYGVHAGPIAMVANQYGSSQILYSTNTAAVANFLSQGNPVIFWGIAGSGKADSWVTPNGHTVNTLIGEHVRLIVGFTGSASHPTSFYINDPIFGRLHWSTAQLQANWSTFSGMGVAIF